MIKIMLTASILVLIIGIAALNFERTARYAKSAFLIFTASKYSRSLEDAPGILVAGDSTGYGTGAGKPEDSIAGRIGADYEGYSIDNISKNGLTLEGLSERLSELPASAHYELMLLQIGGNDVLQLTHLPKVEENLQSVLEEAFKHSKQVIVMSTGNVGGASAFSPYGSEESLQYEMQTRKMREIFIRLSLEKGAQYVDLFVEPEDDIFIKDPQKYLAMDGLHPSSEGYLAWYEKLQPVLSRFLK